MYEPERMKKMKDDDKFYLDFISNNLFILLIYQPISIRGFIRLWVYAEHWKK